MSIDGKVVPVIPTEEMLHAFTGEMFSFDIMHDRAMDSVADAVRAGYKAMLAAAPAAGVEGELVAGCSRSHPHEDMGIACKLRTEVARVRCAAVRGDAAIPGVNLDIILEAAAALERPTTGAKGGEETASGEMSSRSEASRLPVHGAVTPVAQSEADKDAVLFASMIRDEIATCRWCGQFPENTHNIGMNHAHWMKLANILTRPAALPTQPAEKQR